MGRILFFVFSSGGVITALLVGVVWMASRPRSNGPRLYLLSAAFGYLLASLYIVPAALCAALAAPYHSFTPNDAPAGPIAIVLLGGGTHTLFGRERNLSVANEVTAARVLEAVRVYRLVGAAWVISSGGSESADGLRESNSMTMRTMLVQSGVPAERIILESASRDTHDEAVLIARILRARQPQATILVTSADHMLRSIGAFRAAGIDAIPAIAPDARFRIPLIERITPANFALEFTGEVVHELLGIPYYWARGWWRSPLKTP